MKGKFHANTNLNNNVTLTASTCLSGQSHLRSCEACLVKRAFLGLVSSNGAGKCRQGTLVELQGTVDKATCILTEFSTALVVSTVRKQRTIKEREAMADSRPS